MVQGWQHHTCSCQAACCTHGHSWQIFAMAHGRGPARLGDGGNTCHGDARAHAHRLYFHIACACFNEESWGVGGRPSTPNRCTLLPRIWGVCQTRLSLFTCYKSTKHYGTCTVCRVLFVLKDRTCVTEPWEMWRNVPLLNRAYRRPKDGCSDINMTGLSHVCTPNFPTSRM